MITIIVKKEILPDWLSMKTVKTFRYKGIRYFLYKKYYQIKGYEVEELKNE